LGCEAGFETTGFVPVTGCAGRGAAEAVADAAETGGGVATWRGA
jgi:hypothetical protein